MRIDLLKAACDVAYSLFVRWERVSFQRDGVFYVIHPEWLLEFLTQTYWLYPILRDIYGV